MINISDNIWIYKNAISFIEKRYDDGKWYLHMNNGEVLLVSSQIAETLIELGLKPSQYTGMLFS